MTDKKISDYTDIQISKVTLTNGGLKGCNVTYTENNVVTGNNFVNTQKPEMKYPVHEELLKSFGWLKLHLLAVCGYGEEAKNLVDKVEVTGVEIAGISYVIYGYLDTLGTGNITNLKSLRISSEDDYYDFDAVHKIIVGIFEETKVYLSKTKTMAAVDYVIRENKHNPDFNEESFRAMSEELQEKWHKKYLVKNKLIAISEQELLEMKDMGELVFLKGDDEEEEKSEEQIEGEIKLADIEEELTLKEEVVAETFVIAPTDDDSGEINLQGITTMPEKAKVSTAKKIAVDNTHQFTDLE